ncbi:MAG TPA: HIT domain-containing protein [Candidatus Chromulinivoraceae bacterium]|nr:HIT domain-containing protein [Candidatus Chromulinivoraceae bacterium]
MTNTPDICLFCDRTNTERHEIIAENELTYARWDNFPVSNGHAEVIPKRHVASFFDLTKDEVLAIHDLSKTVRDKIVELYQPDAFNLGINDGEAAGRTIHHMHLHLIPRYVGDVENPRGGVRHIIPGKGNY